MNSWLLAGATLALSLLLGACAPNILVQQDPTTTLPGPATYAWDTQPAPTTPSPAADQSAAPGNKLPGDDDPRVNNDIVHGMLHQAVDTGLKQRGYTRTDNPAWLVSFNLALRQRVTVFESPLPPPRMICSRFYGCFDDYDWDWGWGGGWGPPVYSYGPPVSYTEAILIIDLRSAKTHKLVWRGLLTHVVSGSRDLQAEALQEYAGDVLKKLPGQNQK